MNNPSDLAIEIKQLFDTNELDDLKRFMAKRQCLNQCNTGLVYLFHIVQSAGILTTTVAAGYDIKALIWVGVGMNIIASLLTVFEQTNNSMSKRLMKDIQAIREGNYVDEGAVVEPEKDNHAADENKPTDPSPLAP